MLSDDRIRRIDLAEHNVVAPQVGDVLQSLHTLAIQVPITKLTASGKLPKGVMAADAPTKKVLNSRPFHPPCSREASSEAHIHTQDRHGRKSQNRHDSPYTPLRRA